MDAVNHLIEQINLVDQEIRIVKTRIFKSNTGVATVSFTSFEIV